MSESRQVKILTDPDQSDPLGALQTVVIICDKTDPFANGIRQMATTLRHWWGTNEFTVRATGESLPDVRSESPKLTEP